MTIETIPASAVREALHNALDAARTGETCDHDASHIRHFCRIAADYIERAQYLVGQLTTPPEAEAGAGEALRLPQDPTPAMIEAGAARLMSYDGDARWPDSFTPLQQAAARQDAERVWLSMVAATPAPEVGALRERLEAKRRQAERAWGLAQTATERNEHAAVINAIAALTPAEGDGV